MPNAPALAASPRAISLQDRYDLSAPTAFMTGVQALVRLLLEQAERDRAKGLNTAGYVTGYRGSPLGGFDLELWNQASRLKASGVRFEAGLNEDLAATALWGSQQLDLLPDKTVDGVFGLWYGKGPGVDRSGDVLKHGNYAGVPEAGGVLVVFGDDHPGKSSTIAHQSEPALAAAQIPVLYPATVQEVLDFGLHGWALSRYSGLWVGLKCVNETAEGGASVDLDPARLQFARPDHGDLPEASIRPRAEFNPQFDEISLIRVRMPLAHRYARANGLDRVVLRPTEPRLGLVTAGKSYNDVTAGLDMLGLDHDRARALGIGLYKIGMVWPVEPEGLRAFAAGVPELLFVEEKRGLIEEQAAHILYDLDRRPALVGKRTPTGEALLPADIQLDALMVALAIAERMEALGAADDALSARAATLRASQAAAKIREVGDIVRSPWFCSGCPHNRSTKTPEGSIALAGIGCHTMALWMDRDTYKPVQMGGEGANWIGAAPFTSLDHVFQNLGDGTYAHSGLLAVKAAVQAGVNITYKVLLNDAVAMTGGQPVEGSPSALDVAHQLASVGVRRIVLVTEAPDHYHETGGLPADVEVRPRDDLEAVQLSIRETPGVTAIIYEQVCGIEKRRRRKRKEMVEPPQRVFINAAVCEGCGDCSVQSNCVSILPKETPLGRKREIDQSSCNKDFSCIEGFCPSFVTVAGAPRRKVAAIVASPTVIADDLPDPPPWTKPDFSALLTGIGGTGVVTITQTLAVAAQIEGKKAFSYNMTGLAQKGGAVYGHLRIVAGSDELLQSKVAPGDADLLLGCDLVVSSGKDAIEACGEDRTLAVVNAHLTPTARFQLDRDLALRPARLKKPIEAATRSADFLDATDLASRTFGDTMAQNMIMVGYAYQKGWLPLGHESVREAIRLNGAAVAMNLAAFDLGRRAVVDPQVCAPPKVADGAVVPISLEEIIAHRVALLTAYQNRAWARRYETFVREVADAEARIAPGQAIALNVARNLAKLMAYKDEYEVARLHRDAAFLAEIGRPFEGPLTTRHHLAPPLIARKDPVSGRPRKMAFGGWILTVFGLLEPMKILRGTGLDPFGASAERKAERRLIVDYETDLRRAMADLSPASVATVVELAALPDQIRGFGPVKLASMETAAVRRAALLARLDAGFDTLSAHAA